MRSNLLGGRLIGLLPLVLVLVSACATPAPPAPPPPLPPQVSAPPKIDRILVFKAQRRLYLLSGTTVVQSYPIALGQNPVGPKLEEGDKRTPEGLYFVDSRNANSRFYRSLHISYPSETDKARARLAGVSPGANVMIHGLPNGWGDARHHTLTDWTDGCIAVTNEQMDVIWRLVADRTPIEVRP